MKKRRFPYHIQRIFHWVGKAIDQYQMIEEGDRILVGVSGWDSLCLLWVLRERLKWIPVKYEIKALYIDPGFDEKIRQVIEGYLKRELFDYDIIKTDIGVEAHKSNNQKNPCFFCSRERRKKLFTFAADIHYNKIALGHHLDDINATLFVNILYGSSISTMKPRQDLFKGRITIIRPFAFIYREQIQRLANFLSLSPIVNPCPSSKSSQRKAINDLLNHFYKKDQRIRYNIFQAMRNVHREYLP